MSNQIHITVDILILRRRVRMMREIILLGINKHYSIESASYLSINKKSSLSSVLSTKASRSSRATLLGFVKVPVPRLVRWAAGGWQVGGRPSCQARATPRAQRAGARDFY